MNLKKNEVKKSGNNEIWWREREAIKLKISSIGNKDFLNTQCEISDSKASCLLLNMPEIRESLLIKMITNWANSLAQVKDNEIRSVFY